MARASTPTLLSLDRFAQIAGLHPLHFNQVFVADLAPTVECDTTISQHSWQMNDGVSREEIAQAIAEAETDIETFLKFSPAPKYYNELVKPQGHYRAQASYGFYQNYGMAPPNYNLLDLTRGYFQSGGIRATTLLDAASAIAYTDVENDGYKETATVTVPAIPTDVLEDEIKVYYPGMPAEDTTWQIRPIQVSINRITAIATITFKREQALLAALQEAYNAEPADGLDNANFLTTVDVYRVYTDQSTQATFLSKAGCASCFGSGDCTVCAWDENTGCLSMLNSRLGQVNAHLGTFDATTGLFVESSSSCCVRPPSLIRAQYLAGQLLDTTLGAGKAKIQTRYELAIARLAMTKLDRPMCSCESIQGNFTYWTTDLASTVSEAGSSNIRVIAPSVLECPFGTMRAGVWAYNLLKAEPIGGK